MTRSALEKYPLVSDKISDFLLFKQCIDIIKTKEHLSEKGLIKILGLKSSLNKGLSEKLIEAFPNIIPVNRPEYIFKGIPDPFWVSGFISGDGSFNLHVSENNSKVKVFLTYSICLHIKDQKLIEGLVTYFEKLNIDSIEDLAVQPKTGQKKGSKHISLTENTVTLYFRKFSEIDNIIIPFFCKFPIQGQKALDFTDFCKVAKLVKNKDHLTSEGFNRIKIINSTMNRRRPWS